MEQRSCGCSQLWHSAPPGMAVGCCEHTLPWLTEHAANLPPLLFCALQKNQLPKQDAATEEAEEEEEGEMDTLQARLNAVKAT